MIIDGSRAADRTAALILRYYAALNRGDDEGVLDCLADDVVHDGDEGVREIGMKAFGAFLVRLRSRGRELVQDIVVMSIDDGTRAAAEYSVHDLGATVPADAAGRRQVASGGAFFAIHQGKIARITHYCNRQGRKAHAVHHA